jgi:hypothetical protein
VLEIVEGKANGSARCAPVVSEEGDASRRSGRGACQRGLVRRDKHGGRYARGHAVALTEVETRAFICGPPGTCAITTLAQCSHSTRLETRTKESNMYASRWVANP